MVIQIVKTKLKNTDQDQKFGNSAFDTQDAVYIESREDVHDLSSSERRSSATDFAIANNCAVTSNSDYKVENGKYGAFYWLRSASSHDCVDIVDKDGSLSIGDSITTYIGACPCLALNLKSFISEQSVSRDFKIEGVPNDRNPEYRTLTIPGFQYPQTKLDSKTSQKLEALFGAGKLRRTGKSFRSLLIPEDNIDNNCDEFEYNGEYYIRTETTGYENAKSYSNGDPVIPHEYIWIKVEPVKWRIRNWDDLPSFINPQGTGTAKTLELRSEEAILALNFNRSYGRTALTMWQNSELRAYLNGYDLHKEIDSGNGNKKYKTDRNYDYSGRGLLDEMDHGQILRKQKESGVSVEEHQAPKEEYQAPNPYGFVYDDLTNDDLLKLYIKSNASIFLHGVSGVGKSSRVKQIDPTATRISLRPQMNPEEVDGTLDRKTGQYIPPLWYTELCRKCKAEPDRKHVLFIDELTNVKPTVQSLVYSIVLDRAGKDGLWPLPDNTVVVAAGNESAGNLAAYPLTNALFRRFSHIYYEVDKQSWLDWATGINKITKQEHVEHDSTPRARIHPAIVAFVMSRDDGILNQELDEENPHIVTDPRKWEIASNVLYSTKNPKALVPAIGEELTADFTDFVQNIQLSVEDIVNGRYDESVFLEMAVDKKLSTIVGLITDDEKNLGIIRGFISKHLGKEMLATYDSLWIRNDPERAQIIAETPIQFLDEETLHGKTFE